MPSVVELKCHDGSSLVVAISGHFFQRYVERFMVDPQDVPWRLADILPACRVAPRGIQIDDPLPSSYDETFVLWSHSGELFVISNDKSGSLSLVTTYHASKSPWFSRVIKAHGIPSSWDRADIFLGLASSRALVSEHLRADAVMSMQEDGDKEASSLDVGELPPARKMRRKKREKSSVRSLLSAAKYSAGNYREDLDELED